MNSAVIIPQQATMIHLPRFSMAKPRHPSLPITFLARRANTIAASSRNLIPGPSSPAAAIDSAPEITLAGRLSRLETEFESLGEPIERVKRLLHYASRLPPYEESARSPENRVSGCATQVWIAAEVSDGGRFRFRADSDSEISRGFCSCLVWLLDGAAAEEVLRLSAEDLAAVNVGLHGKGQSRANTWHNILMAMQRKTKALVDS